MRNTTTCSLLFLLSFISTMEGSNYEHFVDIKPNKYHQSYVVVEEHTSGNEIERIKITCSISNFNLAELLKCEHLFLTMKQYQEKLIALGYNIYTTGATQKKAINALFQLQTEPLTITS